MLKDLKSVKAACEGHGGFIDSMEQFLGKEGTVIRVLPDRAKLDLGILPNLFWGSAALSRRSREVLQRSYDASHTIHEPECMRHLHARMSFEDTSASHM